MEEKRLPILKTFHYFIRKWKCHKSFSYNLSNLLFFVIIISLHTSTYYCQCLRLKSLPLSLEKKKKCITMGECDVIMWCGLTSCMYHLGIGKFNGIIGWWWKCWFVKQCLNCEPASSWRKLPGAIGLMDK